MSEKSNAEKELVEIIADFLCEGEKCSGCSSERIKTCGERMVFKAHAQRPAQTILSKFMLKSEHEKEIADLKTVLECWHSAFGTTQLTHAICRLEVAEKNIKRTEIQL